MASNPGILSGTPVFRGTRLPVQTLSDYLAAGLPPVFSLKPSRASRANKSWAVLRHGWERIAAELAE